MNEKTSQFHADLEQNFLHREVGPFWAWDLVNRAMIRHWCEVIGLHYPCPEDEQGRMIAPPAMLQVWLMPGYQGPPAESDTNSPFAVFEPLEAAGYNAIVAVNSKHSYHLPVREGDRLHSMSQLESISEEKKTALGKGFFITERARYFNQQEQLVGEMLFRVLKYKPVQPPTATGAESSTAEEGVQFPKRIAPVRSHDTRFFWEGIDRGELRIQRCAQCQALRSPPGPMCPDCHSLQWDFITASGRAKLYSYVVMHHPPIPPFRYPHAVALVELEEGTRMTAGLCEIDPPDIRIGMPVEVVFEEVEAGLHMPLFRPAAGAPPQ